MSADQLAGELFAQVSQLQPELAGRITEILLETDKDELLMATLSVQLLRSKVTEAMRVI